MFYCCAPNSKIIYPGGVTGSNKVSFLELPEKTLLKIFAISVQDGKVEASITEGIVAELRNSELEPFKACKLKDLKFMLSGI